MELGRIVGFIEAIPVGPKGDQQPWGQRWLRARKAPKDGRIGMLVHGLLHFLVQVRHCLV
jgi:hypothetical protein